ncbi:MAG TPA: phage tail protein [Pyrinomonadaceae bacterium]|jgi:phage tail-like protein
MARRKDDPFGNYRFRLEISNIGVAGFAECSGLNMETKVFEYKEGGNNSTTLKFPESTTFANVTLKRGVTTSTELMDWQFDVANGAFSVNKRSNKNNIAIILMNEKGDDVRRWNLIRAFPVKWVGPDLKANPGETAIETLELAHEGIQKG